MILFKHSNDIISYLKKTVSEGLTIGFVPTMGALHPGHLSLINESRTSQAVTVSSIFINPAQFNNAEDFKKYPVTLEQDVYLLEKNGCDVLFLPSVEEIYPHPAVDNHYDLGYLETILEGTYRPGHFQGVCKVVERLLKIINPTAMFVGQKDYQQCLILKRLLSLIHSEAQLIIGSTVREDDGLAMSSRNLRLSEGEREKSVEIYKALLFIKQHLHGSDFSQLRKKAFDHLTATGFKVDYVEIVNADNLKSVNDGDADARLIALIAAYINDVRLIDNLRVTE